MSAFTLRCLVADLEARVVEPRETVVDGGRIVFMRPIAAA